MRMAESLPQTVDDLHQALSRPSAEACEALGRLSGDLIVLGGGGKMGPTLAQMALRGSLAAGRERRVIAVSRFGDVRLRSRLESSGVETISADLLDPAAVAELPDAELVVFMAGRKFGASDHPALTWAMNCLVPALVCQRYRHSRIVAFSSGNIYPLVPITSGGSRETDPVGPIGEYAMSVLGRERVFEHCSASQQTPVAILRLNYATELRYGVLVDIARQVSAGEAIDLAMSHVNVIWQGDANAMALAALAQTHVPARVINLAGAEILRVRDVALRFGKLLNRPVEFRGEESAMALLNNGQAGRELLGQPRMPIDQLIEWTAQWIARGGEHLGKPTHFQVRDGKF
jgi:nucleoside-diphosphate-sugar epimerase